MLHDPVYLYDYRVDLLQEFPRLPFYHEFDVWKKMGQELLDLHLNFETAPNPYPLERLEFEMLPADGGRPILRADKKEGTLKLNERTTLTGVPPEAWEYRLGSRSALEWVLDQYKEKKPRDPTIAERFNTYRFADYKEQVIDLLRRVCTVSVATMRIVDGMAYWDGDELRAFGDRERGRFHYGGAGAVGQGAGRCGVAGGIAANMVGDIFWVRLPLTDLTPGIPRPALVVADVGMRDWVICRITSSNPARPDNIAIAPQDLEQGRLPRNSWVRPGRLFTLEESVLGDFLGSLTEAKTAEILAAVRSLF